VAQLYPRELGSLYVVSYDSQGYGVGILTQSKVKVKVTLQSESLYGWQWVSLYVLASSSLCGRLTRYCLLFKCLGLEFVVLSLQGALSNERPGLSFVNQSLVIWLCVHLLFAFLSFTYEAEVTLRLTASQYVLVSSTLVGLATRYYFLSQCSCLKFAALYLWCALSDERTGLQFADKRYYVTLAWTAQKTPHPF
jgi:hypothetical protein